MPDILVGSRDSGESRTVGHLEGHVRQVELHDHGRTFTRIHTDRFLGTPLVGVRTARRSDETGVRGAWIGYEGSRIEALTGNDVNIYQVEVDRVRVAGQVEDAPDLHVTSRGNFRRRSIIRPSEPGRSVLVRRARHIRALHLNEASVDVEVLIQRQDPRFHRSARSRELRHRVARDGRQ